MKEIILDGTYAGWRASARLLLLNEIPPGAVDLREAEDAQGSLLGTDQTELPTAPSIVPSTIRVPKQFLDTAETVSCYRDPGKWNLLYRVLWRLNHGERSLLAIVVDRDVSRLYLMQRAIARDAHKMEAFVRFRRISAIGDSAERYVAWFAPQHLIVRRVAPFFAKRFMSMDWSILTPDSSVRSDRETLSFGPGVPRASAPKGDELDVLWRTYYASIFNPARIKLRTMQKEMPKRYWQNLPEASLIPGLVADAPARVRRMLSEMEKGT